MGQPGGSRLEPGEWLCPRAAKGCNSRRTSARSWSTITDAPAKLAPAASIRALAARAWGATILDAISLTTAEVRLSSASLGDGLEELGSFCERLAAADQRLAKAKDELGIIGHLVRRPRRVEGQLDLDLLHA